MSRQFYFDCSSGISGDMTVAALLDLGADRQALDRMIESIQDGSFTVKISRVKKSGLDACDFDVQLDAAHENHDHDMEWLYDVKKSHEERHEHGEPHEHAHGHEEGHTHETLHEHTHDQESLQGHTYHHEETAGHTHAHTSYRDVLAVIERADMTAHAKELAVRIFTILGEAEASAHGTTLDHVHFHEVGAVDSIVDILSVAVCADSLGMDQAVIPWLHEGEGTIRCQHGLMPVPVPAVMAVVQQHGLILKNSGVKGELVTPTGAAIAACFMGGKKLPETYRIVRYGLGAGKREYELPGILRILEIETEDKESRQIVKLESDIDDCSGEALGYCMDRLYEAGAREVHFVPVFMKKNRPGWQLEVICDEDGVSAMESIIFRETTTIGIRRCTMERTIQSRQIQQIQTPWGSVRIKVCNFGGETKYFPEYEDVAAICRSYQLSFDETFSRVKEMAKKELENKTVTC